MGFFGSLFGGKKNKGDAQCVACDSTSLTELGAGAYRCNACGYEGGPGFAAWQAQQQVVSLQSLPGVALQKKARKQLAQVRNLISSIEPSGESIGTGKKSATDQVAEFGEGVMEVTEAVTDALGAVGDMGIAAGELGAHLSATRNKRFALMEIRQGVDGLRQILYAWTSKPGHGPTVDQALAASESLLVDSIRNVRQKQGLMEVTDHLHGLIEQGAFGP